MRRFLPARLLCVAVPAASLAQAPTLVLVDSVRVAEADSLFLSRPTRLHVGERGTYFVVDQQEGRIVEIAPSGRILRFLGRKGRGPGELIQPTSLASSGDTLLSVVDLGQRQIVSWDLRTGAPRPPVPVQGWLPQVRYVRGELRVGVLSAQSTTTVYSVASDGSPTGADGALPEPYRRTPLLMSGFGGVFFASDGERTHAVFDVANAVHSWMRGAKTAESRTIPVRARKGVRPSLFDELMQDPSKAPTLAYDRSMPHGLYVSAPNQLVLVTLDGGPGPRGFAGQFHASVLDMAAQRACVDAAVPATPDPLPSIAVSGDMLVVLQQSEGADGEAVTWIRRYRVSTDGCRWEALGAPVRLEGIPDVHYGEDSHWVGDDFGVSEWTLTGTSTSGQRIRVRGLDLLEFSAGEITRKDAFWKILP